MTAATLWSPALTGGGKPDQLKGLRATAGLFRLLGVEAMLGRTFLPENGVSGQDRVAVLGYALWQHRLGGDENLVGQKIILDGEPFTVLGIMQPGFQFPPFWATDVEIWAPLVFGTDLAGTKNFLQQVDNRGGRYLRVFGRLKPGFSLDQARLERQAIAERLEKDYPRQNANMGIKVEFLREPVVRDIRPALLVLMGTVGFVLLIACANVANLLLARASHREREISMRMVLGAKRGRLIRQLLTESLLLALAGAVAGFLLGAWGLDILKALAPQNIPRLEEICLDIRVLGFTIGISLLTGLLFGLAPSWRASRLDLNDGLRGGRRSGGAHRQGLRNLLIVAEYALALVSIRRL